MVNKELLGQAQLVLEVNKEQSVLEVNKEQSVLEVNKVLKEVGVLLELQE